MFVFPDQKICWWKRRNLVFSSKRSKTSHWNYRSQRQMDGEKLWNYCSMVEKSTKQIKKWCNNMVNKNSKCKQQTAVLLFFLLVSHQEFIQHQNLYKKNWMFKLSKNKLNLSISPSIKTKDPIIYFIDSRPLSRYEWSFWI